MSDAGFDGFRLGLVDWAERAASPNAGAGTAGPIGSFRLRPGVAPTTPTSMYLKLNSTNFGWTLQNTINLNVYNVRNYGALGIGTNDGVAINLAIAAAKAAGGGVIYFPPGVYGLIYSGSPGRSIDLDGATGAENLVFLGDGFCSELRMIGSSNLGAWQMIAVRRGAANITFTNLLLTGATITAPDPTEEDIGIYCDASLGAVDNVQIIGCWFGRFVGDGIFLVGGGGTFVSNVKVAYCAFNNSEIQSATEPSTVNPAWAPAENGALLGPFLASIAAPVVVNILTLKWLEGAVAKTATITGTSTIGGTNAANLTAATVNRTTGAMSITFGATHAPAANSLTVSTSSWTWAPTEDGAALGPFTGILVNRPLTATALTINWTQLGVPKTATLTGTITVGGTDAANISAASINRTTGAISITFLAGNAPDAISLVITYEGTVFSRAGIVAQRNSRRVQVAFNWLSGTHDNDIDFEPTGGLQIEPSEYAIVGNHLNHDSYGTDCITFSGISATQSVRRSMLAYNTITNGGQINCNGVSAVVINGNIVGVNNDTAGAVLNFVEVCTDVVVEDNILISENNTGVRGAIALSIGAGKYPARFLVANNICKMLGNAGGGRGIDFSTCVDAVATGNIVDIGVTGAGTGSGIINQSDATTVLDSTNIAGNLILSTGAAALGAGVTFSATTGNVTNISAVCNLTSGAVTGVNCNESGGGLYTGYRAISHNNTCGAAATSTFNGPAAVAGSGGATIEGTAGPSDQIALTRTTAGPETFVSAPIGSLCVNTTGSNATALFRKETGAAATGWLGVGGFDFVMGALLGSNIGAANRYMAPGGLDLAVASATQIQWAVPRACQMRNMRLRCVAGIGAATNTYRIRKNGVDTALTCTISNTATTATDTASLVVFAKGDLVSLKVSQSVGTTSAQSNIVITTEMCG